MHHRREITEESPPALETGAGVIIRGAGSAQSRAVKDAIDSYGQAPQANRGDAAGG